MKKLLSTIFALFLLQLAASAQMVMGLPDKNDLEKVKARTLLVVLREEDPKLTEKLKNKPDVLAAYQAEIIGYNEKIQKIAPKFWTLSKGVIFKPESEFKILQKSKNKEYAYLEFKNEKLQERYGNNAAAHGTGDTWSTATIELRFIEKPSEAPAGYATMMAGNPTETELALAVKSLQSMYNDIGKKGSRKEKHIQGVQQLKTKTLLLDQELLQPGLTEKSIKAAYPYKFKIVDKATIEKAVLNTEKEYAVINIVPLMGIQTISHNVTDTAGNMLSMDVPSFYSNSPNPLKITKESLAQYLRVGNK